MTGSPENAANPSTDALPLKRSVRNSYQNRAVHRSKWWVVLCKVLFVAGLLGAGADYLLASVMNPTRLASPPEKDPAALEVSPTLGAERPKRTLREYPASVARFPGDMPVIGVTSGIEHRAYILQTLKDIDDHILDDRIDGCPITITYCDRRACSKVFVGISGGDALDLRAAGFSKTEGMLLALGGKWYTQEKGDSFPAGSGSRIPVAEYPSHMTSWGEWVAAHPDTVTVCFPSLLSGAWMSTFPARCVAPPANEPVIGLAVNGRSRAYLLAAFRDIDNYVVEDFFDGFAMTVTYCTETHRSKIFQGTAYNSPPHLTFAGFDARHPNGGLLLDDGGRVYAQSPPAAETVAGIGKLPYQELLSVQTTWAEWLASHPETSVYVGGVRNFMTAAGSDRENLTERSHILRYSFLILSTIALVLVLFIDRHLFKFSF